MSTPNPGTTDWVPLWSTTGVGIPQPVVNGQWLKGSGGAVIWSPIAQNDLPVNLQANAQNITDANAATASGWYMLSPSSTNTPDASTYFSLFVVNIIGTQARQIAYQYLSDRVYTRRLDNTSTWTPWRITYTNAIGYEPGGWPTSGYSRMQSGTVSLSVAAGNPSVVTVTLPVPWSTAHTAFIAQGWPGGHWNFGTLGSLPAGFTGGQVAFRNDSVQTINIYWLSIGH